jgi:hypothetical protein
MGLIDIRQVGGINVGQPLCVVHDPGEHPLWRV